VSGNIDDFRKRTCQARRIQGETAYEKSEMKLNDTVPNELEAKLAPLFAEDEEVLYSLKSDLTLSRDYGVSCLVATDRRIVAVDAGDAVSFKLHEITEVKVDELFGSGRLLVVTDGREQALVYYSKSYVPEFAVLCRVLNDLIGAEEPELPDDEQFGHCPKCGLQLPERGGACPMCMPRLRILVRLLRTLTPYKWRAILLLTMTLTTVASQLIPPYITKKIVDDVIGAGDTSNLFFWIGLMLASGVLFLVARLVAGSLTAWLGARIVADLRSQLHSTLQRLRMSYYNGKESGQIISRVMHDTMELQHFLIDGSSYFFVEVTLFVAIAGILLHLDAKLAVLVFLPIPFLIGGGRAFWRILMPLLHQRGTRMGALHSVLNESIRGLRAVKAYSGESRRIGAYNRVNEDMFGLRYRLERTFVGFSEGMFWLMSIGVAAVWFMGARRLAIGLPGETLTLGTLLAFIAYIWLFYGPLQWFTAILNWMTHAFAGAERIFAVLDSTQEVYDAPDAVDAPRLKGSVRFEDVHFSYERGKEVIKGVSFDIAPGEMVGLVGKSGVGKSTIINLVSRFFDVDSGQILIDGHPVQKLKLDQLRGQIGMVMQDPFLFNASIMENIAYGSPNASFADIVRAAKAAKAHDFIVAKEDGYDTVVGERGIRLSGGEKQRLAIARAVLHNPPILILDEATSAVDTETEKGIQEAMATLIAGRTTIGIAHRLSTLRNANRLIIIDDGKIAEIGTHDELISKDGIYANLVKMQSELSKVKGDVWKE
jgi:ATP-binding cassette subfamily B protein